MSFNTIFIKKCVLALEKSFSLLEQKKQNSVDYDIYRLSTIKEFEIIIEQSHKLLKKVLTPYFSSKKAIDKLTFKDIFRSASKHSLLTIDEVGRWCEYRDNRNLLAHDYGLYLAEKTLVLLPQFIIDSKQLISIIEKQNAS